MIDVLTLIKCGIQPTQARLYAPLLDGVFAEFAVNGREEHAAFIGQAMHESINFSHIEESTYYKTTQQMRLVFRRLRAVPESVLAPLCRNSVPFANYVYANVNGNGNEASGDGWRYRGGGLPQLTGKANYRACGIALNEPYEQQPDMIRREPIHAAKAFGWYWQSKRLSDKLRVGGIDAVSEAIVGDSRTNTERAALYDSCLEALTS